MRYHSLLPGALALGTSFGLAACGDGTVTEPTPAVEPGAMATDLAVAADNWIVRANMPTNRVDLATATLTNAAGQSILYAIGGRTAAGGPLGTVTAYNAATNSWTFRRLLPRPLYYTNGAGVIDGKIYISGGCYSSDCVYNPPTADLYVYDPATNSWTAKRAMPEGGDRGVTGVINGKLYVLTQCYEDQGGPWNPECARYNFFRYNPATDRWARLASPPPGIGLFGMGGVIGGKFYAMGGVGANGMLAVYDRSTDQWTLKTPLDRMRFGSAATVLDRKLYVMGGVRLWEDSRRETLDVTIVYDPVTDRWTRRASLPSARSGIAGATVTVDGEARIEVVGGSVPGNNLQYIP